LRLAVLLLAALTACSLPMPPVAPTPPALPQNVAVVTALRHTLFLQLSSGGGCSAVDIGGGRVLTAKHCVDDLEVGATTSLGRLTYSAPDRDWALIMAQDRVKNGAPALRAPRLGEHVYAVGYPVQLATGTQELTVTDGVVAGPSDDEGSLRITVPIYFGNSGGGAWAEDGALLGITVSGYLELPGMNFMVSAEDIAAAL
jgi:hypothetical protein